MGRKRISKEKIVGAFLFSAFDKSAGATSLQDIADFLQIKKASLYNHFSSKDEMYDATLVYCGDYLNFVNFLPEESVKDRKIYTKDIFDAFRQIIRRYVQLYENEPLFQIYTFVHTEQYFNKAAADIADKELLKIENDITELIKGFMENGKIKKAVGIDIKTFSGWFASALMQQIDIYIMHKKEIVRRNPESGAGSLFALPTDDKALSVILSLSDSYIKIIV